MILGIATGFSICFEIIRLYSAPISQWFLALPMLFKKQEKKRISGLTHFLLAILLTTIFFPKSITFVSISFLTIGDVSASIVRQIWGRIRILNKTLEGSISNFVLSLTTGVILHYTLILDITLTLITIGALFSTIFELILIWPDDNYAVFFTALIMSGIEQLNLSVFQGLF